MSEERRDVPPEEGVAGDSVQLTCEACGWQSNHGMYLGGGLIVKCPVCFAESIAAVWVSSRRSVLQRLMDEGGRVPGPAKRPRARRS